MFSIDRNNKISMTRGDNAEIEVRVFDKFGKEVLLFDDDEILLTVRKQDELYFKFQKTAVNGVISIVPEDTEGLDTGIYYYDVVLFRFNDKRYTIIPPSRFELRDGMYVATIAPLPNNPISGGNIL